MNMKATLFLAATAAASVSAEFAFIPDVVDVATLYDYNTAPSGSKRCALVSIAMDESGSMKTEQEFMRQFAIPRMTQLLHSSEYQYDHVFFCMHGFGALGVPTGAPQYGFRTLGCTEGVPGTNALKDPQVADWVNESGGFQEDGYNAIVAGINALPGTIVGNTGSIDLNAECSVLNKNFILVTDEDRDVLNPFTGSNPADYVRNELSSKGYILNEVVDLNMDLPTTVTDETPIGLRVNYPLSAMTTPSGTKQSCITNPFDGSSMCRDVPAYDYDNEWFTTNLHNENNHGGDWTTYVQNGESPDTYYQDGYGGNTDTDYIPLIQDTRGAVWSIRPLRAALSETGQVLDQGQIEAFAEAFIDIKVNEIDCTTNCDCRAPPCRETELGGDPHITTWRNEHYEYHGQCDLVMLKDAEFADGLGIDVHVRTKIVRFWSYIKNVAIRIGNDILEVEGNGDLSDGEAHFWVNYEYQGELTEFAGFPVTEEHSVNYKRIFKIDLNSKYENEFIIVQIYKEFVRVRFSGGSKSFGKSVGLLGDYYSGKTLARDGQTVLNDFVELGHEWQVLPSEPKLFHEMERPQFPEICMEPEDPRGERRRRLEESSVSMEQAEQACSTLKDPMARKDCVYDILATQDLDMIGAF
mmetsp:Transcript_33923/g.82258  ORF Transcript_33923/g.82258 Transcript_33923/m.82258 type:complete len:637 (+) Transcript_33923:50-1960(+)